MKYVYTLLLIGFSLQIFAQGPWTEKKGGGFLQIQTAIPLGTYNQLLMNNGGFQSIDREVVNVDFNVYNTYGITDKFTLISQLPFKYVKTQNEQSAVSLGEGNLFGMNNLEVGVKYRLIDTKIKVSSSLQTTWNTVSKDLDKGLVTGNLANSIGLYGHIGKSILEGKMYTFIDLGYAKYTDNFSDYLNARWEIGYNLSKSKVFWLILNIDSRNSLENGSFYNENLTKTGLYPNNQGWQGWSLKMMYETTNQWGLNIGVSGLFAGNYVGLVGAPSIGIYKKW